MLMGSPIRRRGKTDTAQLARREAAVIHSGPWPAVLLLLGVVLNVPINVVLFMIQVPTQHAGVGVVASKRSDTQVVTIVTSTVSQPQRFQTTIIRRVMMTRRMTGGRSLRTPRTSHDQCGETPILAKQLEAEVIHRKLLVRMRTFLI